MRYHITLRNLLYQFKTNLSILCLTHLQHTLPRGSKEQLLTGQKLPAKTLHISEIYSKWAEIIKFKYTHFIGTSNSFEDDCHNMWTPNHILADWTLGRCYSMPFKCQDHFCNGVMLIIATFHRGTDHETFNQINNISSLFFIEFNLILLTYIWLILYNHLIKTKDISNLHNQNTLKQVFIIFKWFILRIFFAELNPLWIFSIQYIYTP